jgi:hypothetical protein
MAWNSTSRLECWDYHKSTNLQRNWTPKPQTFCLRRRRANTAFTLTCHDVAELLTALRNAFAPHSRHLAPTLALLSPFDRSATPQSVLPANNQQFSISSN